MMNIWLIVAAVVYFLIQNGTIHFGEGVSGIEPQTLLTYAPWILVAVLCFSPPMREKFFAWVDGILQPKPKV